MTTRTRDYLLSFCTVLIISTLGLAQTVSFSRNTYPNAPFDFAYADLNNDGREDRIQICGIGLGNGTGQFAVSLSTGNGTYAPQVCYTLPSGSAEMVVVGDFNNDGNVDVIVTNGPNTFCEYLNNGNGTLHLQGTFTTPSQVVSMVAADANHDGRIDLLWTSFSDQNLYLWFGDGAGGFAPGPTSPIQVAGNLSVGDFDGDGNMDVLSQFNTYGNTIQVAYGDGHGHFQTMPSFGDDAVFHAYDVDSNGTMDLIGDPFDFSINGSTYYRVVRVLHGNSNRTFTRQDVPLSQCTGGALEPAVADFNGDGIPDIVVMEGSDCNGSAPYSVNILLGNPDGSYQPEQSVYSTKALPGFSIFRGNRDSKPDLLLYGEFPGTSNTTEVLFSNTTMGNFPTCRPPNSGTGMALCSPNREVVASSPVRFSVSAANQTPARKMEVWIDGKKAGESLTAWSYYSFLDAKYNMAVGSHTVTVYSAGWDNLLESTTFPLVVGSGTCAPPASPGLNVCSPLNDATVSTSALAWASGTVTGSIARMEVWVDGAKKFSTFGSNTLKTTIPLTSGSHTFAYYIVNTAGVKWQRTLTARVP